MLHFLWWVKFVEFFVNTTVLVLLFDKMLILVTFLYLMVSKHSNLPHFYSRVNNYWVFFSKKKTWLISPTGLGDIILFLYLFILYCSHTNKCIEAEYITYFQTFFFANAKEQTNPAHSVGKRNHLLNFKKNLKLNQMHTQSFTSSRFQVNINQPSLGLC